MTLHSTTDPTIDLNINPKKQFLHLLTSQHSQALLNWKNNPIHCHESILGMFDL